MPDWLLVCVLILSGFVFLVLEVFVIPGFGVMGVLGLGAMGYASYIAYVKLSLLAGISVSALSLLLILFLIKVFPKTSLWKKMCLNKTMSKGAGYSSEREGYSDLLGKEGKTITLLRPVGTALINGRRVDVTAEIGTITENKNIKVVKVEGNRVVVKEI